MGYDGLWTAETQHDPYLPLAVAATATRRIKLGTNIATAFSRSPMIIAQIAWDLQKASGGRFILGLGTQVKGHNERRFSVKWESPGPKLREMIRAIRAIWDCWQNGTQARASRASSTRFDLMTPFFNPGPIEHPQDPDLHRGGEPVHVPARRRALRRHPRAPVQQPRSTCARSCTRRWTAGLAKSGRRARGLHVRHRAASWSSGDTPAERERAGADGEAADRLLRLHAHLPAGARAPRLGET